jgi:hypothetical protein
MAARKAPARHRSSRSPSTGKPTTPSAAKRSAVRLFNGPNQFAVEVTPKATGQRITLEEVGVYTVKNDQITREQFFYDGEH